MVVNPLNENLLEMLAVVGFDRLQPEPDCAFFAGTFEGGEEGILGVEDRESLASHGSAGACQGGLRDARRGSVCFPLLNDAFPLPIDLLARTEWVAGCESELVDAVAQLGWKAEEGACRLLRCGALAGGRVRHAGRDCQRCCEN